jgi:hypothetical protein
VLRAFGADAGGGNGGELRAFGAVAGGAIVECCAPSARQQPGDEPTTRRTALRHGALCGFLSAVCLGLLTLYLRQRRCFFWGFGLGAAAQGGAQGRGRPHTSEFCAVAGRERASGPARRAK